MDNIYLEIERILADETRLEASASRIVNCPDFISVVDRPFEVLSPHPLSFEDRFESLKGKFGIYFVWIDLKERSDDDKRNKLIAAYVGKGPGITRFKDHDSKWFPKDDEFFFSFFECSNRVAKYLEQLFLDCFLFYKNRNENFGEVPLYAYWTDEQISEGTELHNLANKYADLHNPPEEA